jgi:hypothetical protein
MPAQVSARRPVLQAKPNSNGWFGVPVNKTQMTQPRCGREPYRRALAIAGVLVGLASAACGSPVAGAPAPTPGPVTADSVRAALDNSTMDNGHFKLHGTLVHRPTYYPVTGDGVLELRPREALQLNLNVETFSSLGVVKIREVNIGGTSFTRTGTGHWTSKPTSSSPINLTSYVGEEIMSGAAVWHARTGAGHNVYDVWVRESDGYIVQITYADTSGSFTMNFDAYNKSGVIPVPKN